MPPIIKFASSLHDTKHMFQNVKTFSLFFWNDGKEHRGALLQEGSLKYKNNAILCFLWWWKGGSSCKNGQENVWWWGSKISKSFYCLSIMVVGRERENNPAPQKQMKLDVSWNKSCTTWANLLVEVLYIWCTEVGEKIKDFSTEAHDFPKDFKDFSTEAHDCRP